MKGTEGRYTASIDVEVTVYEKMRRQCCQGAVTASTSSQGSLYLQAHKGIRF